MIANNDCKDFNISALDWLQNKLNYRENGVLTFPKDSDAFDNVQRFIEVNDHFFKTPVIYYQAFSQENAVNFFDVCGQELHSKLGIKMKNPNQSLKAIIDAASLQMVIIDRYYLHSVDTINTLLNFFSRCNVALILISSHDTLKQVSIVNHSIISQWEKFTVATSDK